MTDKDIKAIKMLEFIVNHNSLLGYKPENRQALAEYIINLIEKQSKEIEELKDKNKTLKNLQNDTNRLYIEMIERKNYFEGKLQKLEDKIKAKIEVLEKLQKEFPNNDEIRIKIIAYKELLEKE